MRPGHALFSKHAEPISLSLGAEKIEKLLFISVSVPWTAFKEGSRKASRSLKTRLVGFWRSGTRSFAWGLLLVIIILLAAPTRPVRSVVARDGLSMI